MKRRVTHGSKGVPPGKSEVATLKKRECHKHGYRGSPTGGSIDMDPPKNLRSSDS